MAKQTHQRRPARVRRGGFTLIELLVVIGIIVVLIGILIPVVGKMREAGYKTNTTAFLTQLEGAIESYHSNYHSYPGPFSNLQVENSSPSNAANAIPGPQFAANLKVPASATGYATAPLAQAQITSSENLVLGLLGGLRADTGASPPQLYFDPLMVGQGPMEVRTVGLPTKHASYIDNKQLSWRDSPSGRTGQYKDEAATASDSIIPEFVDSFPSPMPVIYLRARVGMPPIAPNSPGFGEDRNSIITYDKSDPDNRVGQYDLHDLLPYTNTPIGEAKKLPRGGYKGGPMPPAHGLRTVDPNASLNKSDAKYVYPYDAYPYFTNPNTPNTARQKDGYILISAGPDRIYGTEDDICNFGSVLP